MIIAAQAQATIAVAKALEAIHTQLRLGR
jgi:hypothetical protein